MRPCFFFIAFLMAVPVYALNIDVSVNKAFSINVLYFDYNKTGLSRFSTEVVNTGSLPYIVQARVDIFQENSTKFTGWSEKKLLLPGINQFFPIYWLQDSGNYTARLRIYYSGELFEETMNITATKQQTEDGFTLDGVHTADNRVSFLVNGPDNAVVIPQDYPAGWSFAQAPVLKGAATVYYDTPLWHDQNITMTIASTDGRYATALSVRLEKDTGLRAVIRNLLSSIAAVI